MTKLDGIGHVGITTDRLQRMTAFYRDVVGLALLTGNDFISIFDMGAGTHFFIMSGAPSTYEFDFASADLDGVRDELVASGVTCTEIKHDPRSGHRSFRFTDPGSALVAVMDRHPAEHPAE